MIVTYEDMKRLTDAPVPFETMDFPHHEIGGRSLKFKKHNFPWSITEIEFSYLYNTILRSDLKRGLDLCTGIGISALSAGLAMKETGGKLVTIDAYIEEYYDNFVYGEKKVLENSDGWTNINYLINKFNLNQIVHAEVGWSPDDVPAIIRKHFSQPLDYVFIDGGHNEEQIIKDIGCIFPYTNMNTVWLLHDCNDIAGIWTPRVRELCRIMLNSTAIIKCPSSLSCHNLALLVKL